MEKAKQGYIFGWITRLLPLLFMEFPKPKTSWKTSCFFLNDAIFWRCFWKNIDVDVFDDVLQNSKHRANDASNDVNRPPLLKGPLDFWLSIFLIWVQLSTAIIYNEKETRETWLIPHKTSEKLPSERIFAFWPSGHKKCFLWLFLLFCTFLLTLILEIICQIHFHQP